MFLFHITVSIILREVLVFRILLNLKKLLLMSSVRVDYMPYGDNFDENTSL